jgi:DNA polymerase-3 subunit epsilon
MQHRPIVFVDVETTGLGARDGHIVEIGAVRMENGKVVASLNQLLDPGVDVPWYITKLTGIRTADVKGMPQFRQVADEFNAFMEGAIFAAHNVDFDYSFFTEEYRRVGHTLRFDRFCTARLSCTLHPQHRKHSLDAIIERGGYQVGARHRAYDDAHVLYQFFTDQLKTHGLDLYRHIDKLMIRPRVVTTPPAPRYVPFFE